MNNMVYLIFYTKKNYLLTANGLTSLENGLSSLLIAVWVTNDKSVYNCYIKL